jgi:hypothetical protein
VVVAFAVLVSRGKAIYAWFRYTREHSSPLQVTNEGTANMKRVFDHIALRGAEYAQNPMFVYLRDQQIDARKRLEFVPWLSHFVMTFADLYQLFSVPNPAPGDRFQELVNAHLAEEDNHWKWFLADLDTIGLNPTLKFTDALRLIWGTETSKTRALAYQVCKMSAGLSSLEKLVLFHAIEATGRVALEALAPVGAEFGAAAGKKLVYFGQRHLDTEREHTVEEDGTRQFLESIEIDVAEAHKLRAIVNEIFVHFGAFADEAYERATSVHTFPAVVEARQQRSMA